ncbi:MAG: tetratricopeptide repeat protein [Desulfurivibrionaceae bacterium]
MPFLKRHVLYLMLTTALITTLAGCATTDTSGLQDEGGATGPVYHPQLNPEIVSPEMARKNLSELLSGTKTRVPGVKLPSMPPGCDAISRDQLQALGKGAPSKAYACCNAGGGLIYVLFKNLRVLGNGISGSDTVFVSNADLLGSDIVVEKISSEAAHINTVTFVDDAIDSRPKSDDPTPRPYRVSFRGGISFYFEKLDDATAFADNLFVIQQTGTKSRDARLSLFKAKLSQYRAGVKPPVTEEQRRLIVQATALSQRKDYLGAIDLYLKALDVDPVAYPGAYFNLALLSAQMEQYKPAIDYMKQYLLLEPGAKDARSGQDKIYEWELMLNQ